MLMLESDLLGSVEWWEFTKNTMIFSFFFSSPHVGVMEHGPGWMLCAQPNATGVLISMILLILRRWQTERLSITIKSRVMLYASRCDKKNGHVVSMNILQIPSINTEQLGRWVKPLIHLCGSHSNRTCRSTRNRGTRGGQDANCSIFNWFHPSKEVQAVEVQLLVWKSQQVKVKQSSKLVRWSSRGYQIQPVRQQAGTKTVQSSGRCTNSAGRTPRPTANTERRSLDRRRWSTVRWDSREKIKRATNQWNGTGQRWRRRHCWVIKWTHQQGTGF